LTIPAADVNSTVSMTYGIDGTSRNSHMVTLPPAQLAQSKVQEHDNGQFHPWRVADPFERCDGQPRLARNRFQAIVLRQGEGSREG